MTLRTLTIEDMPSLEAWWKLHNWPTLPSAYITDNSLIVEGPSGRICAGFMFLTDGPIAWIEFIVGNPLCDKLVRDEGLNLLIQGFVDRARKAGKSVILTSAEHPKLIDRYKRNGAIITDTSMTNLAWRLT